MRRHLALLLVPAAALAAPKKPDPPHVAAPPSEKRLASEKAKPIDIKPAADKLDVFKDDVGNYYVSPRPGTMTNEDAGAWVFYGEGKTFWQQRIIGSSSQNGNHLEWYVWSPRAKGLQAAGFQIDPAGSFIQCRAKDDGKRKLTQLTADEAKTVLARSTFYPPLWGRQSHVLLRDDDGIYYFVDELREELGGNGYRVFVGAKGSLKELPMTNVASDSAGEVFATKGGTLKLVTAGDKATWIKGSKKTELVRLEPLENRYLIYRELGIYGQLGTVCDDQ
ncbi:MAG: hypothetical protein JO257_06645 [Deltaproteobacteria bacterium]|nr:hypothetical protein [Deltaproteobacteria bacterium]